MKFAAIDIGSNAVRLLLSQAVGEGEEFYMEQNAFLRVPVRLGADVFENQKISNEKGEELVQALTAFKHLINAYSPVGYAAYATAAMREATNADDLVRRISKQTEIEVEVIDGRREAEILCANGSDEIFKKNKRCLLIDVGGGSTQVSVVSDGKIIRSRSFNVGALRMLNKTDQKSEWQTLRKWIKENIFGPKTFVGVGSGDSINKIFSLSRGKPGRPISYNRLKGVCEDLVSHSLEARIRKFGLKPDRADVIVPAGSVFLAILDWAEISKLFVPQRGLVDGMVRVLYERHKKTTGA